MSRAGGEYGGGASRPASRMAPASNGGAPTRLAPLTTGAQPNGASAAAAPGTTDATTKEPPRLGHLSRHGISPPSRASVAACDTKPTPRQPSVSPSALPLLNANNEAPSTTDGAANSRPGTKMDTRGRSHSNQPATTPAAEPPLPGTRPTTTTRSISVGATPAPIDIAASKRAGLASRGGGASVTPAVGNTTTATTAGNAATHPRASSKPHHHHHHTSSSHPNQQQQQHHRQQHTATPNPDSLENSDLDDFTVTPRTAEIVRKSWDARPVVSQEFDGKFASRLATVNTRNDKNYQENIVEKHVELLQKDFAGKEQLLAEHEAKIAEAQQERLRLLDRRRIDNEHRAFLWEPMLFAVMIGKRLQEALDYERAFNVLKEKFLPICARMIALFRLKRMRNLFTLARQHGLSDYNDHIVELYQQQSHAAKKSNGGGSPKSSSPMRQRKSMFDGLTSTGSLVASPSSSSPGGPGSPGGADGAKEVASIKPNVRPTPADLFALPFFQKGWNQKDVADMCQELHPRSFRAGEKIMFEGDLDRCMYVITQGTVAIFFRNKKLGDKRRKVSTAMSAPVMLPSPCIVGDIALLCKEPRSATIEAATDVDAWVIEVSTFDRIRARLSPEVLTMLNARAMDRRAQNMAKIYRLKAEQLKKAPCLEHWSLDCRQALVDSINKTTPATSLLGEASGSTSGGNSISSNPNSVSGSAVVPGSLGLTPVVVRGGTLLFQEGDSEAALFIIGEGSAVRLMRRNYVYPAQAAVASQSGALPTTAAPGTSTVSTAAQLLLSTNPAAPTLPWAGIGPHPSLQVLSTISQRIDFTSHDTVEASFREIETAGNLQTVEILRTGQTVGQFEAFFMSDRRQYTAVAATAMCELWVIKREVLFNIAVMNAVALMGSRQFVQRERCSRVERPPAGANVNYAHPLLLWAFYYGPNTLSYLTAPEGHGHGADGGGGGERAATRGSKRSSSSLLPSMNGATGASTSSTPPPPHHSSGAPTAGPSGGGGTTLLMASHLISTIFQQRAVASVFCVNDLIFKEGAPCKMLVAVLRGSVSVSYKHPKLNHLGNTFTATLCTGGIPQSGAHLVVNSSNTNASSGSSATTTAHGHASSPSTRTSFDLLGADLNAAATSAPAASVAGESCHVHGGMVFLGLLEILTSSQLCRCTCRVTQTVEALVLDRVLIEDRLPPALALALEQPVVQHRVMEAFASGQALQRLTGAALGTPAGANSNDGSPSGKPATATDAAAATPAVQEAPKSKREATAVKTSTTPQPLQKPGGGAVGTPLPSVRPKSTVGGPTAASPPMQRSALPSAMGTRER